MNLEMNVSLSNSNEKKNKCCIIGVYFGKLPKYYKLWLKTCYCNKEYDFLIITDENSIDNKGNIRVVHMSLDEFSRLASKKIGMKIRIPFAYKCCDFKPVLGVILSDYLTGYEFWGYCDFDMLLGSIKGFITPEILSKYDKILPLGHLALYRNTSECNNRYKLSGASYGNYKKVFSIGKIYGFDEMHGINNIYKVHNFPIYDKFIVADIACRHKRMRMTYTTGLKNYKHQVFYWDNGHVFRAYIDNGDIKVEEYIYIHYKKRKMNIHSFDINSTNCFFVVSSGFIKKKPGVPSRQEIIRYNPSRLFIFEFIEDYTYRIKKRVKRIICRVIRFINNEER